MSEEFPDFRIHVAVAVANSGTEMYMCLKFKIRLERKENVLTLLTRSQRSEVGVLLIMSWCQACSI